ncbi:MAG TPA: hypothetical protein VFG18_05820, partial [Xanthomonadaceae bacterium]|nr:hypothetical protein [Xanthomonadaceae bacterium]
MSELLAWGVPVLGRALMHFLWQGAAIGLLAAALLHALRGARPQARYAVACLALLACALAPVLDVLSQLASHRLPSALPAVGSGVALLPALGEATRVLAQPAGFDDALPTVVALWAAGACVLSLRMALGV